MAHVDIPADPLRRFQHVYAELDKRRSWFSGAMCLRYAAVTLTTCHGAPHQIAERVYRTADGLKQRAGWFGPLNSEVRFLIAAVLVRRNDSANRFCDEAERTQAMFRERSLTRGHIFEVLATLVLRGDDNRRIHGSAIDRLAALHAMMKQHHRWLTGPDDYPACALFARLGNSVNTVARRVENFYDGLQRLGMSRGNPLQMTSHILHLNPAPDREVLRRFKALHDGFRAAGIAMWQSDYDELATLTFLDEDTSSLVRRVVEVREAMTALRPRPDRSQTFSLACAIAFLERIRQRPSFAGIAEVRHLVQVQSILDAQQAAVVISASTAAATAAASSSSS